MQLDFLIPGFSKCGTTSLCKFLMQHPQIYIPRVKEPNYFAHRYDMGWDWYQKLYEPAKPGQLCGDGSTCYTSSEYEYRAYQRALNRFPDMKVILIARDPIGRLESSFRYMHHIGHKWEAWASDCIGETLKALPNMMRDTMYWQRMTCLRSYFSDDRIHILFLEDFNTDSAGELAKCCRFLGVSDEFQFEGLDRVYNSGSRTLKDTPGMRWLRQAPITSSICNLIPTRYQDLIGMKLGLRQGFTGPVTWNQQSLDWTLEHIAEDSRRFLEYAGKAPDFWPLRPEALETAQNAPENVNQKFAA